MRTVLSTLLSLEPLRAVFARRLRRLADDRLRARMDGIGEAFLLGYRAALEEPEPEAVADRLAAVELERQGFASEGIGMGLGLLDALPGGRRDAFQRFVQGPGAHQTYMLHTGAGWALAVPFVSRRALLARLDPALRDLALDGYGFFRAFFFERRTVDEQRRPSWITGASGCSFDAGLGRRLWFSGTAEIRGLTRQAALFPEDRRGGVWSGLGEACAFAGSRPGAAEELLRAAGPFLPHFAQGIAFAAEGRDRGSFPASHTEEACRIVWGRSAAETAALARQARPAAPLLEDWRRNLRDRFTELPAPPPSAR
jgi:hypothetical protein